MLRPGRAPAGLRQALVRAASVTRIRCLPGQQDFAELERTLIETEARVSAVFEALCPRLPSRRRAARGDPAQGRAWPTRGMTHGGGAKVTLDAGQPAPDFDLPTDGGGRVAPRRLQRASRWCCTSTPRTTRPGCTKEAQGFAEAYPEFRAAGIEVLGISKDSVASHDKFKAKYQSSLPACLRREGGVVEAYGSWVEKSMYGKAYMGIDRSTFLIDGDGTLRRSGARSRCPATLTRCWTRRARSADAMSRTTLPLTDRLYEYLLANSLREHPALAQLRDETSRLPGGGMQIAPEQGQFMALLVELTGARRVLEIGCFTGYSALAMALALPPDGRLITLEVNAEPIEIGRRAWRAAGVADRIEVRLGLALDNLDQLLQEGGAESFDLAFIDADKKSYDAYYERALALVRPGGLILLDNMFWGGAVADPADRDAPDVGAARAERQAAPGRADQPVAAAARRRPDAGPQAAG